MQCQKIMQPSYLYIKRQKILEFDNSSSALKLPSMSSFSSLCKLYHSFWLFQRNLCYGKWLDFLINSKWNFWPVYLATSRPFIILELISKPLIIFCAGPWSRSAWWWLIIFGCTFHAFSCVRVRIAYDC